MYLSLLYKGTFKNKKWCGSKPAFCTTKEVPKMYKMAAVIFFNYKVVLVK